MDTEKPVNIILEGLAGSKAYGLDHAESDEDLRGVYVAPTSEVLSLHGIAETIDHTNPDWTYHEVGKFIRLALACNPTILEMLYLDEYRVLTEEGRMLVEHRHLFLSKRARLTYGGYVLSQARKLAAHGDFYDGATKNRYEKHTRHLFRLLQQGQELLATGTLTVRVSNREELFAYGKLAPEQVLALYQEKIQVFDAIPSVLPDEPDITRVNALLLQIRRAHW